MADGLNRVMLLGNLGADPDLRFTQSGQAVLNMRLATTESYLDKDKVRRERTDWHNVVIWGKRGEALAKILIKGSSLFVEGSLRTSSYDDRDGVKRYKTEIIANNILLTGKRGGAASEDGGGDADEGAGDHEAGYNSRAAAPAARGGGGGARPQATPRPSEDPRVPFNPRGWTGDGDFKGKTFSACTPEFLDCFGEAMTWSAANPKDGDTRFVDGNKKNAKLAAEWAAHLRGGGSGSASGSGGSRGGSASRQAAAPPADTGGGGGDDDYGGGGGGGRYDDDIPFISAHFQHDPTRRFLRGRTFP